MQLKIIQVSRTYPHDPRVTHARPGFTRYGQLQPSGGSGEASAEDTGEGLCCGTLRFGQRHLTAGIVDIGARDDTIIGLDERSN